MEELGNAAERSAAEDPSVAELVKALTDQTGQLMRQELELAKAELAAKGKQAGLGAGMFGGATIFGLYAVGALTACLTLALATAMAGWLAALIVAVIYAVIAGAMGLTGKSKVQESVPPVPEQAVETLREDVAWTKQRAQAGRR